MDAIIRFIEVIGFVVGVIAVILAVVHLREIRAQAKKLFALASEMHSQVQLSKDDMELSKTNLEMLKDVLRTQSTHQLGPFPEYIEFIAECIEGAQKGVLILCDFPSYGSFSAPQDFLRYRQAIERKIEKGIPVHITYLASERRLSLIQEQFFKEEMEWKAWKDSPQHKERLAAFVLSHTDCVSPDSLSREQFFALLEEEDAQTLATFKRGARGAHLVPTSDYIPLYCWIADGKKAVFAIPTFSEDDIEHGFSTIDPQLIDGFKGIMARYDRLECEKLKQTPAGNATSSTEKQ